MRDHTKLRAFELADEVVLLIYKATKKFPREEVYGITSQMRRAAISVPSNIVEGCARSGRLDYQRFLQIAFSSLKELHYQLDLSNRLGYLSLSDYSDCDTKIIETEKVLCALLRSLKNPSSRSALNP